MEFVVLIIILVVVDYFYSCILTMGQDTNDENCIIKINKKFMKGLKLLNVFLAPFGIIAFLGIIIFANDKDLEGMIFTSFIFIISLLMLGIFIYYKKNKLIIKGNKLEIIGNKKTIILDRKEIIYKKISAFKVRIYDLEGKRIRTVTNIYDNYDRLLEWLSK